MLRAGGHVQEFTETVKAPLPSSIQKRAALWALGQVGSSALGFNLLASSDIVEHISGQAKRCHTLSMRGTCFYILGLLSRTELARSV
jgi:rapamycin-insensitive companion of mTOR